VSRASIVLFSAALLQISFLVSGMANVVPQLFFGTGKTPS
jgi:hypothetical protein